LVDNDIEQGLAFAAKDVVSVVSHGGDALVVGELDSLGLLDFGCFFGISELAAGLVMGALGNFELDGGLLGRGLDLGGGSLETGGSGSVRVGGGHGRSRSKKEAGGKGAREKRKVQLKIALVCETESTSGGESGKGHQRGSQKGNTSCRWSVTEGRVDECS